MKINTRNLLYIGLAGLIFYLVSPKLVFLILPFLPLIVCGVACAAMVYMLSKQQKNLSVENKKLSTLTKERDTLNLKIEELQSEAKALTDR